MARSFADAKRVLCAAPVNGLCGSDCLTNLTCLGGVDYFKQDFYWKQEYFETDDGKEDPMLDPSHELCTPEIALLQCWHTRGPTQIGFSSEN